MPAWGAGRRFSTAPSPLPLPPPSPSSRRCFHTPLPQAVLAAQGRRLPPAAQHGPGAGRQVGSCRPTGDNSIIMCWGCCWAEPRQARAPNGVAAGPFGAIISLHRQPCPPAAPHVGSSRVGADVLPVVPQGVAQGGRAGRAALHLPGAPRHRCRGTALPAAAVPLCNCNHRPCRCRGCAAVCLFCKGMEPLWLVHRPPAPFLPNPRRPAPDKANPPKPCDSSPSALPLAGVRMRASFALEGEVAGQGLFGRLACGGAPRVKGCVAAARCRRHPADRCRCPARRLCLCPPLMLPAVGVVAERPSPLFFRLLMP
jgi:hypothetical protein